jgi:RimJ/RimL family protein N-acetyltransferase
MTGTPRDALPQKIETPRLLLRQPIRGDVAAMVPLADNKKIADMLAVLPHPYTRADGTAFVEIMSVGAGLRPYAILLRDKETFIGIVSLSFAEGFPPELGYWLGEPYWGRGYGFEAAGALVAAAKATGLFPAIRATAKAHNTASRKILTKVGLSFTGEKIGDCGKDAGIPIAQFAMGEVS